MRKKDVFLLTEEDLLLELGDNQNIPENPPDRKATSEERQLAAEISVFLEDDLGIDVKRLFIQVRDGHLYVQGSVDNIEQKKELESTLPLRPHVKSCETQVSIQNSRD